MSRSIKYICCFKPNRKTQRNTDTETVQANSKKEWIQLVDETVKIVEQTFDTASPNFEAWMTLCIRLTDFNGLEPVQERAVINLIDHYVFLHLDEEIAYDLDDYQNLEHIKDGTLQCRDEVRIKYPLDSEMKEAMKLKVTKASRNSKRKNRN